MIKRLFPYYAYFYLCLNLIVILSGALVRATNSGAGCGASWPLCQGNVLPDLTLLKTLIEFFHRVGSGLVGVGALILIIFAFRAYPKKHIIRFSAATAMFFVILEGLLGAGLVVFGLVENDVSLTRLLIMGWHLANTFLLLGAITLTAGWSNGFIIPTRISFSLQTFNYIICLLFLLITGALGAMTALSDTLFKPEYMGQDFFKDLFNPSHILQSLRIVHPIFALLTSAMCVFVITNTKHHNSKAKIIGYGLLIIIAAQIFSGILNLAFLTPIVLQLVHLLLADILWIGAILYFNDIIHQ